MNLRGNQARTSHQAACRIADCRVFWLDFLRTSRIGSGFDLRRARPRRSFCRLRSRVALLLALASCAGASLAAAEAVRTQYSLAELVAEHATLPADGGAVNVGLHIEPKPGWHAYWINPGDAGLPPSIDWTLPAGFAASELQFPTPQVIPFGELVTYGFDEPILLLSEVAVPADLAPGEPVLLQGHARWVVCDDQLCVPDKASLTLALPPGDGGIDANQADRFDEARAKLPAAADWPSRFERQDDELRVTVQAPQPAGARDPYLFITPRDVVRYGRQTASAIPGELVFTMDAGNDPERLTEFPAVLNFTDSDGNGQSVRLEVKQAGLSAAPAESPAPPATAAPFTGMSLATAFVFAFIGGVILNLMPCVFPILSMKALSLVTTGHTDARLARHSGLLYTAGILVAFALIGGALVALREAGQAVGWGFQLQSPLVNLGLALLMLAIGLNLFGVFEIGTRVAGVGQSLTAGGERRAAFFTGLLAVLVATPCTAPFMAGALGYALVQTTPVALGIFVVLGFGLAFPYLLVSFVPAFGRIMPRPGPWMGRFRNILAFPMLATAVWLFWIIGKQLGVDSMAVALLAALALGFALWAYGQAFAGARPWLWRTLALAGLLAAFIIGARVADYRTDPAALAEGHAGTLGQISLERFTPERVGDYVSAGQPVFVYFTADWCVNCKVNERVALASDAVGRAFRERGIRVIEADWTNEDPTITEWLGRYGRVGVPLYLYFPSGSTLGDATILPQILLPEIVIDALDAADRLAA